MKSALAQITMIAWGHQCVFIYSEHTISNLQRNQHTVSHDHKSHVFQISSKLGHDFERSPCLSN